MTRKKTIRGFFLTKINKQHELILDQTYADLLDCLAACVVASDFTRFHNYLKELNYSSDFTFVSELAEKNSEYAHIDYLRKHFFIESFALLGDFAGLLNAQRTLAKKGDIRDFSWLTQTKKGEEFEEKRRAFRMETFGGPLAFFG